MKYNLCGPEEEAGMDEAEGAGFVPAGTTRPAPVPPFDCATYSMLFFKVLPCQKKYNHDWTCCPGAHPGERARRRCLLVYRYGAKVCPDMQTRGVCPRGESCYMTHGMFEYYMHPLKYKTKMCKSGPSCRRHYCFFSHSPDELRESANIPDEWQLQILPDSSVSSSSTSAVLSCLPAETRGAAQAAIVQLPQIIQMFESGTDRMMQPQQMLPLQLGTGQIAQGAAAWGSASMASSSSHFDSGSNLLVHADAVQQYGSPSMMMPQHTFNTLQQQTEVLQYGPACGLHSNSPGMGMTAQPAACVLNTGQPGVLVAQQPLGGVSIPGGAAGAAQSPGYLAGRGLQPASGGWVSAGTPSQLPYGAGNSASMAASPPILGVQGTMLMPAQGGMYLQSPAGAHQVPHGFQQQQQPYLPPPQSGFMPQRAPNMGALQLAQQQQPAGASAPLSNTMLLQQLQQLQQPQMLPGGMVIAAGPACGMLPSGGPACSPQQQLSGGAASSHLMQQLQALTLTSVTVSQQL